MKIDIKWNTIPTYEIDVAELSSPYEICTIMKRLGIECYVYSITFKGILLKFGMSADNSRNYGERLYRQVGHSKSWGALRLKGSCGSDWRIVEEEFLDLYNIPIEKNHLKIKIWDLTNYEFETIDKINEILYIESTLIQKYKDLCGEKPLGNIHDDEQIFRRRAISQKTWNGLFEV